MRVSKCNICGATRFEQLEGPVATGGMICGCSDLGYEWDVVNRILVKESRFTRHEVSFGTLVSLGDVGEEQETH